MTPVRRGPPSLLKVMVAGGPAAGKATFINTLAPRPGDDAAPGSAQVTLGRSLLLDLTALPAGEPSRRRQNEIARGCVGAVVLADPCHPARCLPAVEACRRHALTFVVALNPQAECPGRHEEARAAAGLGSHVPVVVCDARDRASATLVLIFLFGHVLRASGPAPAACGRRT